MSRPRLIALLLAFTTLVVFLPASRFGFVNYDDPDYVTENSFVQNGLTGPDIQWAFTTFHASNWHPLTWLSHMTDCTLFRLNPGAHHFVNVLFHAANAALLFTLLWRLTGLAWPSGLVAALFAWHPLHVESVAWIAERKDVLSAFFALLALLSYTKWSQGKSRAMSSGTAVPTLVSRLSAFDYWLALVWFTASLMAKPMFVTLPFVLLLLDYWPLQRFSPSLFRLPLWLEKLPFFLLAAASCAVTFLAQRGEAVRTIRQVSLPLRLENAATAGATYLAQIFWPANLSVFYPLPEKIAPAEIIVSLALLALISVLVWRARKSSRCWLAGWLWFLGTLVPVIGLVKVGDAAHADRYTYFPAVGIFLAVGFGGWNLLKPPAQKKFIAAGLVALAACVILTEHQLQFWADSESLFRRALAVTANNSTAHLNLGVALETRSQTGGALAEYYTALRLDAASFEAASNLGKLLFENGRAAEALDYCRTAVRLKPGRAKLHTNLGLTLVELGRYDEALAQFAEAARLDAADAIPHFQTGRTLLKLGRDAESLPQLFTALQREPDNLQFLVFTARVLASDDHPPGRDAGKALALADQAVRLAGEPQPVTLDTLALALAAAGRFDEAKKIQQQAVELVAKGADRQDLSVMEQRLQLYEKQMPWRESFLATNAPVKN